MAKQIFLLFKFSQSFVKTTKNDYHQYTVHQFATRILRMICKKILGILYSQSHPTMIHANQQAVYCWHHLGKSTL